MRPGNADYASSGVITLGALDTGAANADGERIDSYTDNAGSGTGNFDRFQQLIRHDASPMLNGTLSAGLAVGEVVSASTTSLMGHCSARASVVGTTWTFNLNGLSEDVHTFEVRVEDEAGNQGAASDFFLLTVDTSAPAQTVTITSYTDDAAAGTGSFGSGHGDQRHKNPVLSGTLSAGLAAGEVVRIYEGATLIGAATVVGTAWTFALPALANGSSHSYTAVVEDAAGNAGTASSAFTLTVDTSAPTQTVTIDSYTDNAGSSTGNFGGFTYTDDASPMLNGTLSAGLAVGEVVRVYDFLNGTLLGTASVVGTTWTFNLNGLSEDVHTFEVRVEDEAGNQGAASDFFLLTVDTSAPTQTATITGYRTMLRR